MRVVGKLVLLFGWLCGIVLANGFWSTLFAFILPLWAWYLVAEKALKVAGWLP